MIKNSILFQKLSVWPDSFKTEEGCFPAGSRPVTIFADQRLKWHYSFSIGFFGFHYIRAVNENDAVLCRESLQILRELVTACNLDSGLLKGLNIPEKRHFLDFWEDVIRPISWVLGDAFGQGMQQMVKLGFWLAAVYADLVGELSESDSGKITGRLVILGNHLSELNISSQQSNIPESLIITLNDLTKLLRYSKTPAVAHKCMKKLKLVLKHFLLPKTTE